MKKYLVAFLLLIFCNVSFAQKHGNKGTRNHGVGNGKGKGNYKHYNKEYKYVNGRYYYNYNGHRYYRTPAGVRVRVY